MMKYLSKLFFISFLLLLSSCQTSERSAGPANFEVRGFEKVVVQGGDFWITTYQRIQNRNDPYVFYIEGDGLAFVNKHTVSTNPTPRKRMFIDLAAMDKRPNVIYVGRPCQYTPMSQNPKCNKSYWTGKRLSGDSVDAINEVINKINNDRPFSLIGYSGGGGIAILIAARNPKVHDIITIAGNLDHRAFTEHHHVTPMSDSLNPIDYAKSVRDIPQWHISGSKDTIVPPFIAAKYVEVSASMCVHHTIFPNVSHRAGWDKVWNSIYSAPVTCHK